MSDLSSREQQIVQVHAAYVIQVVKTVSNPAIRPETDYALKKAAENGWASLVKVTYEILEGKRDDSLLLGLDEEDGAIIKAILRGIQNPETLPDPQAEADASQAAPGIANIIFAAGRSDMQALQAVSGMAEQMSQAGGDMALLAAQIRPMIHGERNVDKLSQGMSSSGEGLMTEIVKILNGLDEQSH